MRNQYFLSTAIILVSQLFLHCTVDAAAPLKKPTEKTVEKYIGYSFDKTVERLPSWFIGHDVKRVFWALNKPPLKKGEFETTDEFIVRKSNSDESALYEELNRESILAFSYPVSELNKASSNFKYDADTAEMIVNLLGTELVAASFLSWQDGKDREYMATNSSGVRVKVTDYDFSMAYLATSSYCTFRIPVAREIAPTVKKSMRALYIGRLKEPYLSKKTEHVTPTISKPEAGLRTDYEIKFKTEEVWLYDGYTGRIYARHIN